MDKILYDQLDGRKKQKLEQVFQWAKSPEELQGNPLEPLLLTSPSDLGVVRNGGRCGARYAPAAILAVLKKMIYHGIPSHLRVLPVWDLNPFEDKEDRDFSQLQSQSAQLMVEAITKAASNIVFHLGGGHDHIFCLMLALEKMGISKITVLNIDAHCDTRTDPQPHSGNPFRLFSQMTKTDFHLIQLGIHPFANDNATMTELPKGKMTFFSMKDLQTETRYFQKPLTPILEKIVPREKNRAFILSLDCDVLESSLMEGVSAVNHHGLPFNVLCEIFQWYKKESFLYPSPGLPLDPRRPYNPSQKIIGIYEYNPLFDNLSQKGARALASLIYQVIYEHPESF